MNQSTTDQITGKLHELKGSIKEEIGKATNNDDLTTEGQAERVGGTVQSKVGEIEKVFGK
jgi:uncharacterized protein YjbJ (UPF0337 family)